MDAAALRVAESVAQEQLAQSLVFSVFLPIVATPDSDERTDEVGHSRWHDNLVAESQGLARAVLVVGAFAVLRLAELVTRVLLIKVEDLGDHHATGRAREGMLLRVLVADLSAGDDLGIAGDTDDRIPNCHRDAGIGLTD